MNVKEVGNPIKSVLSGIVFIIIATIMLIFNEGNAVKNAALVAFGRDNYIQVPASPIDSNNNGKLIATNGTVTKGDDLLVDNQFNLSFKDKVVLKRHVEMFQYVENEEGDSDTGYTYTYSKKWDSVKHNSSNFHTSGYDNPREMPFSDESFYTQTAKLGDFRLTNEELSLITYDSDLDLASVNVSLPDGYRISSNYITNTLDEANPQIGDVRVYYTYFGLGDISVLAEQQNGGFSPYRIKNGKKIHFVQSGILTGDQILDYVEDSSNFFKIIFRVLGVILMMAGFSGIFAPLAFVGSFVPLFGKSIRGFVSFIGSMIGLGAAFVIIAISWIAYRPILAFTLLGITGAAIVLGVTLIKKAKKKGIEQSVVAVPQDISINGQM